MAIKIGGTTVVDDSRNISNVLSITGLTTPLSVAQGGTGTATPAIVAGTGVSVSGSFPNQTITNTGATTGKAIAMAIVFGG